MGRRSARNPIKRFAKYRSNQRSHQPLNREELDRSDQPQDDACLVADSPPIMPLSPPPVARETNTSKTSMSEDDEEEDNSSVSSTTLFINFFEPEVEEDSAVVGPTSTSNNTVAQTSLLPSELAAFCDIKTSIVLLQKITEIYKLGMDRGVSIQFMNDIVRLFRNLAKEGHDISKVPLRDTFMKNIRKRLGRCAPPIPIQVRVPPNGPILPKFCLLRQICDLMASNEFRDINNLVVNTDESTRFQKFVPAEGEELLEVNSGSWYSRTYDQLVENPSDDWLFPLILYVDKTGTDAMQRFPLEPLMFTTSILKRNIREQSNAWRHMGFVPQCDDVAEENSPEQNVDLFHRCLEVLLSDLARLQRSPPMVQVSIGGISVIKRLILPVAFVMGDQLSQDKHCARKAVNAGGAGKIHRRCMCSSMTATRTSQPCCAANKLHIEELIKISDQETKYDEIEKDALQPTASKKQKQNLRLYVKRRSKFARTVLEKVYSMYPINNAWSNISFGANCEGIYRSSLDDPMHYSDSGSFLYLAQVVFGSMTLSERMQFENLIKLYFKGKRSSVREDLPRGKFTSGFTRTTLLTAGEKIGLIFSLFVCLGIDKGVSMFRNTIGRIQQKYQENISPDSSNQSLPKRGDVHFFSDLKQTRKREGRKRIRPPMERTLLGVQKMVRAVVRHNLSFLLVDPQELDELQTEYFLQAVHTILCDSSFACHPFPDISVTDLYEASTSTHDEEALSLQELAYAKVLFESLRQARRPIKKSSQQQPQDRGEDETNFEECTWEENVSDEDDDEEEQDIESETEDFSSYSKPGKRKTMSRSGGYEAQHHIPKHNLVRPRVKGAGPTSAILTDVEGFRKLLLRALCFHSFVHYFEGIPKEQRQNLQRIGGCVGDYVKEYCRCVYRGDDSVDCDTCKMHAHLHLASDIREYGHPMNWDAGKGERGLKVWAKMASSTAHKLSLSEFTYQTALRVSEGALLSMAGGLLSNEKRKDDTLPSTAPPVQVRKQPHYIYDFGSKSATENKSNKAKNEGTSRFQQENATIFHEQVIEFLGKQEGQVGSIKIWKDAKVSMSGESRIIRACSVYDKFGAFFDWIQVQSDPSDDLSGYPAKLLLIYEDRNEELCGIIHGCEWRNTLEKKASTPLTSRWSLEYSPSSKGGNVVLRKIKLSEIADILYVIEHTGEKKGSMGMNVPKRNTVRGKFAVDVVQPQFQWAVQFLSSD